MYYIGIDAGSTYLKEVIIKNKEIIGAEIIGSGIGNNENADKITETLCRKAGIKIHEVKKIMATGYSRRSLDIAEDTVSEITAHAYGARINIEGVIKPRLLIDIGGQDCKVICINEQGKVENFFMNDKCAAGTGKFIEVVADILDTTLDEVGDLSIKSLDPCEINSTCVVFAQTEIISLIAQKKDRTDILAGLHMSMAKRIGKMGRKHVKNGDIVMTGGGAKNIGLVQALEDELMAEVFVAKYPQFNGAIGAAVYAQEIGKGES